MGRAVTSGLSGLDKRKSWLMNNSGDVAWRYRWGGWGLARIHADKRERQGEFFGGGRDRERPELCYRHLNILIILFIFNSRDSELTK